LYDLNENPIFPPEDQTNAADLLKKLITKTQNVALVIECGGVWFANGKFGVTWRFIQAVVKPKQSLMGKCYINLSTDEKVKMSKRAPGDDDEDDDDDDGVTQHSNQVVDSSDDESMAETPAEEVAKVVAAAVPDPPKKKVVRKKKGSDAE